MSAKVCSREMAVLRSASAVARDPELDRHLETCEACRSAMQAHTWMNRLATVAAVDSVPDARSIWVRAEFARRRNAYRAVARPIANIRGAGYVLAGLFPAILIAWNWSAVDAVLRQLRTGNVPGMVGEATASATSILWLFVGVGISLVMLTVNMIWAEE